MQELEIVIRDLQFLLRTYDGLKKLIVQSKQRLKALNPEAEEKHQKHITALESEKDKLSRKITKALEFWEVWTAWAKHIPGIGPFIAGNLIILFFYRFVSICQKCGADLNKKNGSGEEPGGFTCSKCGESAKGDGILKTRIEEKDFANVSKWWKYMGEANDEETGRMVRRKKGVISNWSSLGRQISWSIGESLNKCSPDHHYKAFYLRLKAKEKRHSDAIRRTRKLFLSHFWHVARELEGKSTVGPYADVVLNHTGIIAPYYWESLKKEQKAA